MRVTVNLDQIRTDSRQSVIEDLQEMIERVRAAEGQG
jgi:hypothetical protein